MLTFTDYIYIKCAYVAILAGLTTPEVLHWAQDFTTNYPKLFVNGHVMHHLLEDEKYLCYTFLHHHAVSGDR